jgi:surface polysaccharide O-acyltransferase-like enzyme
MARLYYIDWLKSFAIIGVVMVHCLMNSFDACGLDSKKNIIIFEKINGSIRTLV